MPPDVYNLLLNLVWKSLKKTSIPFGHALIQNTRPLPSPVPLSDVSLEPFPYFFVEDAAFPLRSNLMRPFPGANLTNTKCIFNYRLSRVEVIQMRLTYGKDLLTIL